MCVTSLYVIIDEFPESTFVTSPRIYEMPFIKLNYSQSPRSLIMIIDDEICELFAERSFPAIFLVKMHVSVVEFVRS